MSVRHVSDRPASGGDRLVDATMPAAMAAEDEDRDLIAESVEFTDGEEASQVHALYASIEWDEDTAPGRPEMTGRWHIQFRDSLPENDWWIDLPVTEMTRVQHEVRRMVARRLYGDTDLSGGQPHIHSGGQRN
jgi:hypothetical protein